MIRDHLPGVPRGEPEDLTSSVQGDSPRARLTTALADRYHVDRELGQGGMAVRFTRLAVTRGFINYPFLAEHAPFFEEVRRTDDFKRLLDEVRPRWEAVVDWERRRTA